MRITYPFVPKSTTYMRPGQFWSIPLESGRYACGRVIQICSRQDGKAWNVGDPKELRDLRCFLGGVLDWSGDEPPTSDAIAGIKVIKEGDAHILTISANRGQILGYRPLELDGIEPAIKLNQSPGRDCRLMRGYDLLGLASEEQQASLKVFSSWGFQVAVVVAEMYFGDL